MFEELPGVTVVAVEVIPPDTVLAKLAVPLGALIFFGTPFLLLRAILGTRRAYLVLATSFFGFMILLSLFWTFGAPGTPQVVGPSYLPGQEPNAYEPTWTPFARTSQVAQRDLYDFVQGFPEGFSAVPEGFAKQARNGATTISSFFAAQDTEIDRSPVPGFAADWKIDQIRYAEAENGFPVIAVTYLETGEQGEVVSDPRQVTLFGFFDPGSRLFPSLVVVGLAVLGFAIHVPLLAMDEKRQRREEAEADQPEEEERVPAGA